MWLVLSFLHLFNQKLLCESMFLKLWKGCDNITCQRSWVPGNTWTNKTMSSMHVILDKSALWMHKCQCMQTGMCAIAFKVIFNLKFMKTKIDRAHLRLQIFTIMFECSMCSVTNQIHAHKAKQIIYYVKAHASMSTFMPLQHF